MHLETPETVLLLTAILVFLFGIVTMAFMVDLAIYGVTPQLP